LNQPLTAVVSNAEAAQRFMKDLPINDQEVREALQDIREEGRRAGEIIARMRAMVKKDPGQMARQDLNLAVREVLEMAHSELMSRRVAPVLRLDPLLPLVNGHGVQLRQVLLNLVINACDAMSGVAEDRRQLTIASRRVRAGEVEISVSDTGPGVTADALRHVFEPFRTTKSKGLGLGLAICRSIIRTHGGRLNVANNLDGGAKLRFTLPVQNQTNV
jgi:C4-dicarboxylate-specific signal transduction histidine kinase